MNLITDAELLRTPQNVLMADPRTLHLAARDTIANKLKSVDIEIQHSNIVQFVLNETVPADIIIHFETAKNCYLYAWFVFRFYQVAEQQAYATLELALRERFPEFVQKIVQKSKFNVPPSLSSLLKHAQHKNVLRNELFNNRDTWARSRAEERHLHQIHLLMMESNLSEVTYDYSGVQVSEEDLNCDWLSTFIEHMPDLRNDLAHGSARLRHTVLHTFDVIQSMINMLYPNVDGVH